jgi:hypothetical protein
MPQDDPTLGRPRVRAWRRPRLQIGTVCSSRWCVKRQAPAPPPGTRRDRGAAHRQGQGNVAARAIGSHAQAKATRRRKAAMCHPHLTDRRTIRACNVEERPGAGAAQNVEFGVRMGWRGVWVADGALPCRMDSATGPQRTILR